MRSSSLLYTAFIAGLAKAGPVKRWYPNSVGANYFQTNGFDGNQLVASYILPDGTLVAGTATWTGGNGSAGINDPSPYENHPDPFYGSASVIVAGNQVFAVNAGSNSFSVFDIDPTDPARPSLAGTYPSNGDFPISVAASPDNQIVCVLNAGANNGVSCYKAGNGCWTYNPDWDRPLGLNLTTPPHGPVGGTPSQLLFTSDYAALQVVVKGQLPVDLNNPTNATQNGFVATYAISQNRTLAAEPVKTTAALPFSISEDMDNPGLFVLSDVSTGFAIWEEGSNITQGTIPNQAAVCWVAQSPLTKSYYVVDIGGKSNITEISVDVASSTGTINVAHPLGVNASGTDVSIFSGGYVDWMYVNAPAYQSIHAYEISAPGQFKLIQRYKLNYMSGDVEPSKGFAGQAVYYK